MKILTLVLILFSAFANSQSQGKIITLKNNFTDKTKKINLQSTSRITYSRDSTNDGYTNSLSYYSYSPYSCNFTSDEIEFNYNTVSYYADGFEESSNFTESWDKQYDSDSIINLPYKTQFSNASMNNNVDISISRQTKVGKVLFGIGGFITYCAILNSVFVAPMLGLNNGSFKGYSFPRLWKSELYSGVGLSIGVPLLLIFKERQYFFQNPSGDYETWTVVEGN